MNGIHLVSASAGSGKTHRLVDELEGAITRAVDPVRPEAVIATTFTVKAAAELRERVRTRLLENEHVDSAQRLRAARIGTVNSVCAQLVTEFAFELGVSPEPRFLDEDAAAAAFEQALSGILRLAREDGEDGEDAPAAGSEQAGELLRLIERWPGLDLMAVLRELCARARENGLAPARLREGAERSVAGLLGCYGPAVKDGDRLDRALEQALAGFLAAPHDDTKQTGEVVALATQIHARLHARRRLAWCDWSRLAAAETAKRSPSREAYERVREAARDHERHPALREEIRACITLVFELAAQALEAYERHKRAWGMMDFVDQEVLALELLGRPHVQDMLRQQVDLVLVDEFQDTSPLQLEVFLALSRIARRSVWVGDQKQAIYGFRGTDPALMDTVLEALAQDGESLETLRESWRSRAELVRLTSDVFAPAFAPHGIPAERVRLEPAGPIARREDTLGPVIEHWRLEVGGAKKAPDAQALAVAVRALLDDPAAQVRDAVSNEPRRVRPRDVAVLCRSSSSCARATRALEAAGIAAVRARTGLADTPEARAALAALRLWVDPREALAAAELGRLLAAPDAADAWLAAVLDAPGEAYASLPEVGLIAAAAALLPLAGPVAAFDAALEAAGVREACLRWGDCAQRLANLDALRGLAAEYAATCEQEGQAATVAGFVAHVATLADERDGKRRDEQAVPETEDAVTVSTLHGAKGLEWPVTVLFEIDHHHPPSAFGVHVESDRETFALEHPLAGRWIRFWPDPYRPAFAISFAGRTEVHDRVRQGAEYARVAEREVRETLRLLYVGWTRARDRLVFAARPGKMVGATLQLLAGADGRALVSEPGDGACTWAGRAVAPGIRRVQPAERERVEPEPGAAAVARGPRQHPPAHVNASTLTGTGRLGAVAEIGAPLFVQEPVEWSALGSACHAFLASDRPGLDAAERVETARALLEAWSVQAALRPDDLARAGDDLCAWAQARWPGATWRHEWPIRLRREDGSVVAGFADLVLETADGLVLVDHKCLGGTREQALDEARGYAGQLAAYATALELATGRKVLARWVHLVAQGVAVAVESDGEGRS